MMSGAKKARPSLLSPKADKLLVDLERRVQMLPVNRAEIEEDVLPLIAQLRGERLSEGSVRFEVRAPLDGRGIGVARDALHVIAEAQHDDPAFPQRTGWLNGYMLWQVKRLDASGRYELSMIRRDGLMGEPLSFPGTPEEIREQLRKKVSPPHRA